MSLSVIIHMLLLSYVTCDVFNDIFEMSFYRAAKAAEVKLGNIGTFNNCAPAEAKFHITWDPDPLVKGEEVTIEGNYTFPEDFETGTIDVAASVFSDTYKIKCKDVWDQPCKKGATAYVKRSMPVPTIAPAGFSFKLTAKLINDKTEHEIMCAYAMVQVKEETDTKLRWKKSSKMMEPKSQVQGVPIN